MRAQLNDTELLKKIQSAKSPSPLTAEEVAKLAGSMRHKVVPLLRGLAASGHLEIVDGEGGNPVRFVLKQTPSVGTEQFTDNVVNHPSSLRRKEDKTAAAKTEAQPTKPRAKKTASAPAATSLQPEAPAKTSNSPSTPARSTTPAQAPVAAVVVSTDNLPAREKILLILKQSPMGREAILRQFGAMGDVLQEMIQAGEVGSEFIIDDHVYELTDKGNQAVEAIIAKAPVVAETPMVILPAVEEPVAPAPVVTATAETVPVQPALEPLVAAPKSVAVVNTPDPAPSKMAQDPAPASPQPVASQSLDNPIMKQVAELVEKLVSERLTELTQELSQRANDREKLVAVAAGIQKATAALQLGIDALNEVAGIIAE